MKYLKILPAAASMIALTSVTCFAQDQRENEEADISRTRVMVRATAQQTPEYSTLARQDNQAGYIYLVEVERGSKTKEIVIDAHTGAILGKRDITTKA